MVQTVRLLRWLYLGRLTLAAGIFGGALMVWRMTTPGTTLLATLVLLLTLGVTIASFWYTSFVVRTPGRNFLYAQVLYDTLLVTAVVHMTGGPESDFAPLYIVVIAVGALLLPRPGGALIGAFASILYAADIVWGHTGTVGGSALVQIALFAVMALITGTLGDRLRRTGTALGELESELRQLRLETTDILRAIDTGVVTVDAAGRLEYLNPAAESMLGIRARDWLGRRVVDELQGRAPGLGRAIEATYRTGAPARRWESPAEGERVLGGRTTLLDRGTGQPWVTAVIQDITDGKRVDELHRRAERLQAVAELSASLAHEIKNPLASIRSSVEQLVGKKLADADRGVLQKLIVRESERLSRLLSEFLEFSRVELRDPVRVDLRTIVADAVALVESNPDRPEGVRFEVGRPNGALHILGDADLLHRAVFNLVLNAAQHAGADGSVRLELARARDADLPAGITVARPLRLSIVDSGPGIPEDRLPRIFDPFYTTRKGGTGLGLALVHRAVEAHQGAILVDGAPGRGARFTIYLPAAAGEKSNGR